MIFRVKIGRIATDVTPAPYKSNKRGMFPRAFKAMTGEQLPIYMRSKPKYTMDVKPRPFAFTTLQNASRPPAPVATPNTHTRTRNENGGSSNFENNEGTPPPPRLANPSEDEARDAHTRTEANTEAGTITGLSAQALAGREVLLDVTDQYEEEIQLEPDVDIGPLDDLIVDFLAFAKTRPKSTAASKQVAFKEELLKRHSFAVSQIQSALVELERKLPTDRRPPETLVEQHRQLMQLAVDLAFPRCANALRDDGTTQDGQVLTDVERAERENLMRSYQRLIEGLSEMRLGLSGAPKDRAKVSGAFLRAIADNSLANENTSPLAEMDIANGLLHALSKGDGRMVRASTVMQTNLPEVRAVLSALRSNFYADQAAWSFLQGLPEEYEGIVEELRELGEAFGGTKENPLVVLTSQDIGRALPEELAESFGRAVYVGRQAAAARDTYERAKDALVRAVGEETGNRLEGALITAGAGIRVLNDDGTQDQHLDGESAEAVQLIRALSANSKGAAFQIAKLAVCMEAHTALDNKVMGHNRFGFPPDLTFNTQTILIITGVTDSEVEELGYQRETNRNIHQNFANFGDAGLSTPKQAIDATNKVHRSGRRVLRDRTIQDALRSDLDTRTKALIGLVRDGIKKDAVATFEGTHPDHDHQLDPQDKRKFAFRGISAAVKESLFTAPEVAEHGAPGNAPSSLGSQLDYVKDQILETKEEILPLAEELADLETRISENQAILANQTGIARNISIAGSKGVECAELILDIVEIKAETDQMAVSLAALRGGPNAGNLNEAEREREQALQTAMDRNTRKINTKLKELKNYNLAKMERRSGVRYLFSRGTTPKIDDVVALEDAAQAVKFLRTEASPRRAELEASLAVFTQYRRDCLEMRASAAPGQFNAMYRIIYSAILENMPDDMAPTSQDGQLGPVYDMGHKREDILATLRDWGVDVDAFAPEIDYASYEPLDSAILATVKSDMQSHNFAELLKLPFAARVSRGQKMWMTAVEFGNYIAHERRISEQARDDFRALFEALEPGQKYDMNAGSSLALDTWKIPLDPMAINRVRGRLKGTSLSELRIEVSDEGGFTITGQSKKELNLGAEYEISHPFSPEGELPVVPKVIPYARLGGKATVDLTGSTSGGFTVSFPPGDAGTADAVKLLMALTHKEKPAPAIMENAEDIAVVKGMEGGVKAKAGLLALFGAGVSRDPVFDGRVNERDAGVTSGAAEIKGVGVEFFAGAEYGMTLGSETRQNANRKTVRTEVKILSRVYAEADIYRVGWTMLGTASGAAVAASNLQNSADKAANDGEAGLWNGGWAAGFASYVPETEKSEKRIRVSEYQYDKVGKDGLQLLTSAELVETASSSPPISLYSVFMGNLPDDIIEKMRQPGNEDLLAALGGMLDKTAQRSPGNTKFQVSYRLPDEQVAVINELKQAAQTCRENKDTAGAKAFDKAAQRILEDRKNYVASSITLLETSSQAGRRRLGNGVLVQVDRVANFAADRVVDKVEF